MRKLTQKDFLEKAAAKGIPYSFDKFEYLGNAIKSTVTCSSHGEFMATPNSLFNGYGCPSCWKERRGKSLQIGFDEFVKKAREVHGHKYDYSPVGWRGITSKVSAYCHRHGLPFKQVADNHVAGQVGCPVCKSEKMSLAMATPQEEFIKKCQTVHGNTYDYSKVNYSKSSKKITVICPLHGEFYPQAGNFINSGSGCPKCAHEKTRERSRHTFESYLARFREVHGEQFIYHDVYWKESIAYVKVECKVHGLFDQVVQDHLRGVGCAKCSFGVWDQGTFLAAAEEVHGKTYDYSKTVYKKALEKVIITCRTHGDFLQAPNYHINAKHGCRQCSDTGPSKGQVEVFNFLSEFVECKLDYRFSERKELDIFIPSLNIGIEYNGLIWHSTKFSKALHHMADKSGLAAENGIRVIHLYQDEWETSRPAVEGMLKQAVGVSQRVFARNTHCKAITQAEANAFFSSVHLRGGLSGNFDSYGLFDKSQTLLAVMAFSRVTSHRGSAPDAARKELRRYAATCAVVGGPSKILHQYLKDHKDVKTVVTYSENRAFTGEVYRKMGFTHTSDVPPDYWYVSSSSRKRYSKSRFRRSNLPALLGDKFNRDLSEVENCVKSGWYRLFDCGKKKWELNIK